jgi:hypothetical protein
MRATQLRDIWAVESLKQGGSRRIDVLSWLSKATLDVIGLAGVYGSDPLDHLSTSNLAGFNYRFDALSSEINELNDVFAMMFRSGRTLTIIPMLKGHLPFLLLIVSNHSPLTLPGTYSERDEKLSPTGMKLGSHSRNRPCSGLQTNFWLSVAAGTGEKQAGCDPLSLLVQANMATDLPESQRMSDEDVLARTLSCHFIHLRCSSRPSAEVPTFIVVGHGTTR